MDHFTSLEKYMGVNRDDLGLWEPDDDEIERLQFIAESRCAGIFRDAFLDSVEYDHDGLAQFGWNKAEAVEPPANYTTALSRLHEPDSRNPIMGIDGRKRAWNDLQRLLIQQVIQPVRELAMTTSDPVQRAKLMGIAELSFVFHTQSVLVGEKLNRRIAERGIEHVEPLASEDLKILLKMAEALIKTAKATEQCSQPRTTIVQPRGIDSRTIPHLPHSG